MFYRFTIYLDMCFFPSFSFSLTALDFNRLPKPKNFYLSTTLRTQDKRGPCPQFHNLIESSSLHKASGLKVQGICPPRACVAYFRYPGPWNPLPKQLQAHSQGLPGSLPHVYSKSGRHQQWGHMPEGVLRWHVCEKYELRLYMQGETSVRVCSRPLGSAENSRGKKEKRVRPQAGVWLSVCCHMPVQNSVKSGHSKFLGCCGIFTEKGIQNILYLIVCYICNF